MRSCHECSGLPVEAMSAALDLTPQLIGVPWNEIDRWQPRVIGHLRRIAKGSNGRFLASDLVTALKERDMQLWVAFAGDAIMAVALTEIIEFPRVKCLSIMGCCGRDWRQWAHLRRYIELWGRKMGCEQFRIVAPLKWRHLIGNEYAVSHVIFEKG